MFVEIYCADSERGMKIGNAKERHKWNDDKIERISNGKLLRFDCLKFMWSDFQLIRFYIFAYSHVVLPRKFFIENYFVWFLFVFSYFFDGKQQAFLPYVIENRITMRTFRIGFSRNYAKYVHNVLQMHWCVSEKQFKFFDVKNPRFLCPEQFKWKIASILRDNYYFVVIRVVYENSFFFTTKTMLAHGRSPRV